MQLRYAFRLYPDAAQQAAPARAFGCARVVLNDAVRAREDARTRLRRTAQARAEFERAASLTRSERERELLLRRAVEWDGHARVGCPMAVGRV